MLNNGDRFPLLRLKGDINYLTVELVESSPNTPYVSISHVWADGLGNPSANSLHFCRLIALRDRVSALISTDESFSKNPLIWLDTLCCPAEDGESKQLAIKKLRLVYHQATHVLVLDSGLMAYGAQTQDVSEKIVRAYAL